MLISLSGKKRSGKSSVTKYLVDTYGFVEVSWAEPLKEIIGRQLFGLTDEQLYGPEEDRERIDHRWGMSARQILQEVGTKLFRQNFMDDFWVRIGILKIKDHLWHRQHVVVSDTRFPNEIKAVQELEGKTIRMKRPDCPSYDEHYSEIALDDAVFDHDISAPTGHLEDVYLVVDAIVANNAIPKTIRN